MKYRSVFDIIGPIMIGPSSSHTAGAVRIGLLGRNLFGRLPKKADILLFGSFAKTYKGHGTDIAIIGGILGFSTDDKRLTESYEIAKQAGVEIVIRVSDETPDHPNTAMITLSDDKAQMSVQGISHGGGKVEVSQINDYPVQLSGEFPAILILHQEQSEVMTAVTQILTEQKVKIKHLEMANREKNAPTLTIIETDQPIQDKVLHKMESLDSIEKVVRLEPIS